MAILLSVPSSGRYAFSVDAHAQGLRSVLREVAEAAALDGRTLDRIVRKEARRGGRLFSKNELIRGARALAQGEAWDLRAVIDKLRMKPVRTSSGVAPVTVLTEPYPCPGRCVFCPNDVRMPKSYLSMEPGAQRAAQHRFDPFAQTTARLMAFFGNGHPIDKVELIVLGGTWSAYPEAYQRGFILRCFEAMNVFDELCSELPSPAPAAPSFEDVDGELRGVSLSDGAYNRKVRRLLDERQGGLTKHLGATWQDLKRVHRENETARARCVGLALETRPDHVSEEEVGRLRRLGATKVQLGVQSLDDEILARNRRGHDVAATRRAFAILRGAGFKIHAHWMPNLLGATPERDEADFRRLFEDPAFRPDELKVYPCALIETAELMRSYEEGTWRPYRDEELVDLLSTCLAQVPEYCRVTRVIRDIPSHDIVVGNTQSNFREVVERSMDRRGLIRRDIRSREIRRRAVDPGLLELDEIAYPTATAEERFVQYVTPDRRIAAFVRLSLPRADAWVPEELRGSAIIREVHVYGAARPLGERGGGDAQHAGLGGRLVDEAGVRAARAGFRNLSVISAIGTRAYYRSLGFTDGRLYSHRAV